jgi:hypothetical protein
MADIFDLLDPVELTEVARLALADEDLPMNQLILENWFPNTAAAGMEFTWSTGTTRTYTDSAPFRAWSAPGRIGRRPGRTRKRGEMGPIKIEYPLSEDDIVKIQAAQEQGGDVLDAVSGDVFDDITAGIRAVRNRMEILRADALVLGSSSLSENGITISVDFLRSGSNEGTVATSWADATNATPMNDEETILDLFAENGLGPDDIVRMENEVTWRQWKATDQVRLSFPSVRELPIIGVADLNELRSNLELPMVIVNKSRVNDSAGTNRKVIPDGMSIYLPKSQAVGETQFGELPISGDPRIQIERDNRRSLAKCSDEVCGSANHGGMLRSTTSSRMALLHGRTSA